MYELLSASASLLFNVAKLVVVVVGLGLFLFKH